MNITRKLCGIILIAALFAIAGCQMPADTSAPADDASSDSASTDEAGAAEMVEIRYGGQYYPGEFLLKGSTDLWGDSAVDHILFSSGTENNQALISGQIDINVGSDSKTASLFSAIPDTAVIIATTQRGDRYSTIVRADADYESWEDLKGKTVGTRLGTGAEQVLLRYFDQTEGLSWDDFEWVNLKIEDMVAALDSGSIEAFTAWEPTPAIAEAQEVGRALISFGDIAIVPVSMHTTVEYAENNRAEIVEFLKGHIAKVEMIESDPDKAAEMAAEAASAQGIEVTADAFKRIFERVDFSLAVDDAAIESINDTAQFLVDQGKLDAAPELRWDTSFLEEAMGE